MTLFSRKTRLPFRQVLEKLTTNLEQYGLNVISTTDLKNTFSQRLKVAFRNYVLIQAISPSLIYEAISLESHAGVMLPCNILVQEHENGEVEVSAINPAEGFNDVFGTPLLAKISGEVTDKLRAAIDDLHRGSTEKHIEALPSEQTSIKLFKTNPQ